MLGSAKYSDYQHLMLTLQRHFAERNVSYSALNYLMLNNKASYSLNLLNGLYALEIML